MTKLSQDQIVILKKHAHSLKPVILLGAKGLTEAVQKEIAIALRAHELIKIRLNEKERSARLDLIDTICTAQQAELVQHIGHIATIYKKRENAPAGDENEDKDE